MVSTQATHLAGMRQLNLLALAVGPDRRYNPTHNIMPAAHLLPTNIDVRVRVRMPCPALLRSCRRIQITAEALSQLPAPILFSCIVYFLVGLQPVAAKFFIFMGFSECGRGRGRGRGQGEGEGEGEGEKGKGGRGEGGL